MTTDPTSRKTLKIVGKTTKNQHPTEAALEGALMAKDAIDQERKGRRREDRRRLVVGWIGGFSAFVGVNGSFIFLCSLSGIIGLLFDEWRLWRPLSIFLLLVLYFGWAWLLYVSFFWLSDKTGFYFCIEDWIEAWDTWDAQRSHNILKFKAFPRGERRALVRDLKKELDVINNKLYHLEEETYNNDDKKLSDSVWEGGQLIISLSSVSSSLLQHRASWKAFVLELEETFEHLEFELADIVKYHEKVQSPLKQASQITAKSLFRIIDSGNSKEAKNCKDMNSGI